MDYVVVWDPEGEYWDGALVDEARRQQLEARGVACLPVSPALVKRGGCAGWAKRSWGAGWPLDYAAPRHSCALTLLVGPECRGVEWKARIVPARQLGPGEEPPAGHMQFAADAASPGTTLAGIASVGSMVQVHKLGRPDAHGGWTVGGAATLRAQIASHAGFGLYGAAPGVRVAWLAASVTLAVAA